MLLTTKLFVPAPRPDLVARPQLRRLLEHHPQCKLILISAPAGFGKTTLVTEWLDGLRKETGSTDAHPRIPLVAWLSLDEGDNDPIRFITYLIAALQKLDGSIGGSTLPLLQAPQPPSLEHLLTLLINDLNQIEQPWVLVLDDYHTIEQPKIHAALTFFVEHAPVGMRLVLTTRVDPPLPLARWRVKRLMAEIRSQQLRFSEEEASIFLQQTLPQTLSNNEIAALTERTEGWIAGLQLAALSMAGRSDTSQFIHRFTGNHLYVMDYLVEEVLHRQSAEVETFLLRTSILERFNASLCTAVTGYAHAQTLLEQLERANLFLIPLDSDRQWYRYHHLFAEVLQHNLKKSANHSVTALHRQAARWYQTHGLTGEAIHHAFASDDPALAADLIEIYFKQIAKRGEHFTIASWLEKLPRALLLARPTLALAYSNILIIRHELDEADRWLQQLESLLETKGADAHTWAELLYQRAHSATRRYDFARAVEYGERGLQGIDVEDWAQRAKLLTILGVAYYYVRSMSTTLAAFEQATECAFKVNDLYIALYGLNNQAETLAKLGRLQQAIYVFRKGLQLSDEHGLNHLSVTNRLHVGLSLVLYEVNALDAMQQHVEQAFAERQRLNPVQIFENQVTLAKLQYGGGHAALALRTVEEALAEFSRQNLPVENSIFAQHLRVELWLTLGKAHEASTWASAHGFTINDPLVMTQQMEYIAFARILLAEGRNQDALNLLQRLIKGAAAEEQECTLVELWAIQSLALNRVGNSHAARQTLLQAIQRGSKDGFVRCFVTLDQPMQRMLAELVSTLTDPALQRYVERLLTHFDQTLDPTSEPQPSIPMPIQLLVEPLSERELEVLRLVADGLSNSQIADKLIVAVGTVKRHLNNIFGKLGVSSRTQAIVRAREVGLLT